MPVPSAAPCKICAPYSSPNCLSFCGYALGPQYFAYSEVPKTENNIQGVSSWVQGAITSYAISDNFMFKC